jgi:hypothetical protein
MGRPALVVDCAFMVCPRLGHVDRLARLQLRARRRGYDLWLANASPGLVGLIRWCGLAAVLRVQAPGQAEEREQARGVEEEGELGDAPT